jgi:ParB/RepB/Spo0J family partition protein
MSAEINLAMDKSADKATPVKEVGNASATEAQIAARKKAQPKSRAKKSSPTLALPNGCSLSAEMDISVSELVITQRRDEGEKGRISIQNLSKSLKCIGQLSAIIVRHDPTTGKYLVVAGNRRTAAAIQGQIPTLRCRVFEGPDNALQHVISAIENAHREQEAPWSLALKLRAAIDEGFDQKQLAEMFQKSQGAVSDMLFAVKLPAAYRKRIEKGENLYKVVSEYRKSIKTPGSGRAVAVATEQPAGAPAPETAKDTPTQNKSDIVSAPLAKYPISSFEHEGITITVTGSNEQKPLATNMVVALRHVLGIFEIMARREQEERSSDAREHGVSPR